MQVLDSAGFGLCRIGIRQDGVMQDLDSERIGSCKVWIMQDLDHATLESCNIRIIQDSDHTRAILGSCKV